MSVASPPAVPLRRWTHDDETLYMSLLQNNSIRGWLHPIQMEYVKLLTQKQHEMNIWGPVGEIGIHHGKFLLPLAGMADVSEPVVGWDLFEMQDENVDASGSGKKNFVIQNLMRLRIPENSTTLISANSLQLSASVIAGLGLPLFRMLSVDGGHTLEITLHDMMVASCILADGGILMVDDVTSDDWIGVNEAMMHFASAQSRLVPFQMGFKKTYFTTPGYVKHYQEMIAANQEVFTCRKKLHASRRTIAGYEMCYSGPNMPELVR